MEYFSYNHYYYIYFLLLVITVTTDSKFDDDCFCYRKSIYLEILLLFNIRYIKVLKYGFYNFQFKVACFPC